MENNTKQKEPAGCVVIGLSFLIPILGIILYFVKKEDTLNPDAYLWAGIVGFVINMIIFIAAA